MLCDNKNICARCSTCTEVTILCFVSTCIAGLTAFSKTSAISQLYRKERRRIRRTSNSGRTDHGDRQLAAIPASWHHPAPRLPVPPLDTPLSKKMKLFSKRYRSTPPKRRYHAGTHSRILLYNIGFATTQRDSSGPAVTLQHETGSKVSLLIGKYYLSMRLYNQVYVVFK